MLMDLVPLRTEVIQVSVPAVVRRDCLLRLQVAKFEHSRGSERQDPTMLSILILVPVYVVAAVVEQVAPNYARCGVKRGFDAMDKVFHDGTRRLLALLLAVVVRQLRESVEE